MLCYFVLFFEVFIRKVAFMFVVIRSSRWEVSLKKLCLKCLQNSQENTSVGVSVYRSYRPTICNFIKNRQQHFFSENFAKSLKKAFLQITSG